MQTTNATNSISRLSRFKVFSLRNYPLDADQMEDIGISSDDMQQYAKIMAETLAILHWAGEMDGNDVEFDLASRYESTQSNVISNALSEHITWLLDFDVCRQMSMDEDGVRQAVTASLRNDSFYPRSNDQSRLWTVF